MTTNIYILSEPDGEIRYVGKTMGTLKKRFSGHLHDAISGIQSHRCHWVRLVISKGLLPAIRLIGEVDGDGCKEEIAWIAYLKAEGFNLTNETVGGEGMTGRPVPEKTRLKISSTLKMHPVRYWLGKHRSEETRKKIGVAHLGGKGNGGYKFTEEDKRKNSLAHKGVKLSEEHKREIGLSKLGNKDGFKKGQVAWNKGKAMPAEVREKIRLKNTGRKHTDGACARMSVAVKEWWRKRRAA